MNIALLILIQVIVFAGLVFFLRKMMYTSYSQETQRLQAVSNDLVKKSQEAQVKLKEAEAQGKKKLDDAEEEIRKLKIKNAEEIEKLKEEMMTRARQEADKLVQLAMGTKDKIREELKGQEGAQVVEQALKLVRSVLSSKNLLLVHKGLVHEMIDQMGALDLSRLQIQADKGELISPVAVDKEDKDKIVSVLSAKIGKPIMLSDAIDQELVAGVSIKLGSFIIDGSLSKRLKESAEHLKKA
jgi:F-type H+-transporting ATPase subunit b